MVSFSKKSSLFFGGPITAMRMLRDIKSPNPIPTANSTPQNFIPISPSKRHHLIFCAKNIRNEKG